MRIFRAPVDASELRTTLIELLRNHSEAAEREKSSLSSRFQEFVGSSERMRRVYDAIRQVASSSINVLIRGESGTWKGTGCAGHCQP